MSNSLLLNMAIEIVDLPINSMVDLSSSLSVNVYLIGYTTKMEKCEAMRVDPLIQSSMTWMKMMEIYWKLLKSTAFSA